jgi:GT2 family glycosyltransferase
MRIVAILTSHNRREKTLACLRSYFDQALLSPATLEAVLVDDGSTDGTAEAVQALKAPVTVVRGAGDLYWASGMALAEREALRKSPDYLLWLNDDVVLDGDALSRLHDIANENDDRCIAVGALRDPITGDLTYSGIRRHGIHPLRVEHVQPEIRPIVVDTFHGNAVLVPLVVNRTVGPIDGAFAHAAADFDYGLRAVRRGIKILLAPGTVGTCLCDSEPAPWLDLSIPIRERSRLLFGPKGLPPRSAARYLRRHGGRAWPLFWIAPYAKFALVSLRGVGVTLRRAAFTRPRDGR